VLFSTRVLNSVSNSRRHGQPVHNSKIELINMYFMFHGELSVKKVQLFKKIADAELQIKIIAKLYCRLDES
jgi:hypothetical protein